MGLILSIGGFLCPLGISKLGGELEKMSEVHSANCSLSAVMESQKIIHRITRSLLIPEIFSDATEKSHLCGMLADTWSMGDEAMANFEALPRTREVEIHWGNLKSSWEAWRKTNSALIQLLKDEKREQAVAFVTDRERDAVGQVEGCLKDLQRLVLKLGKDAKNTEQTMANRLKTMILAGTAIGIMMALLFGFLFSRSLTRPIKGTIKKLSETYGRFMATADQLASASHQLSGGTASQAAAVRNASAITEELTAIVKANTEDVQRLKEVSEESGTVGFQTFELFRQSKKATKEIKLSIEETSKIVKTIGEIAFQSNLLALSASIEAARTSEAGIGFSVVAQEVRNLSLRSTEASKNTSNLIEETGRQIDRGDDLVRASLSNFIAYGEGSMPITEFTVTASEMAQKQAQGIEQINGALKEISLTAQKNAGLAQESAEVAQEISAQAQNMARVVEGLRRAV